MSVCVCLCVYHVCVHVLCSVCRVCVSWLYVYHVSVCAMSASLFISCLKVSHWTWRMLLLGQSGEWAWAPDSLCLLPSVGITGAYGHAGIYRSSGERNSSPHACPISALPTKQSLSHQEATLVTSLSCDFEDHFHGFWDTSLMWLAQSPAPLKIPCTLVLCTRSMFPGNVHANTSVFVGEGKKNTGWDLKSCSRPILKCLLKVNLLHLKKPSTER